VILSVAFGTVDLFQNPFPIYEPWFWSTKEFSGALEQVCCGGDAIFMDAYIRTFVYVICATSLCLVLGYAVAY
jgi:spermidine/putrescine transport system permease protein